MIGHKSEVNSNIFNTPLEIGFRTLFTLNYTTVSNSELQRLIYYDYLMLHSKDVNRDLESLHPSSPFRVGEILIKRNSLKKGLSIMSAKGLIKIKLNKSGIYYTKTNITNSFLEYFDTMYANNLKNKAVWVAETFDPYTDHKLDKFFKMNIPNWGSEFILESFIREYDE